MENVDTVPKGKKCVISQDVKFVSYLKHEHLKSCESDDIQE